MRIVFIFFVFCFACSCQEKSLVFKYLDSVQPYLDSVRLERFKESENDSIIYYFGYLFNYDRQVWNDSLQWERLMPFFDTVNIVELDENELYYLCFALHDKINGLAYDNNKILERCNPLILERKKVRDENKISLIKDYEQEGVVMKTTDKNHQIGESIDLIFNAKYTGEGVLEASYDLPMPDKDIKKIKLCGKIIEKLYSQDTNSGFVDTIDIYYQIKILKLNYKTFLFYEKKYMNGDTLILDLRSYGKPL